VIPEPNAYQVPGQTVVPSIDVDELTRTNALLSHSDYTVAEAMREIARQIPDRVAIDTGAEKITFAEVESRANQVANALLDRELDPTVPILLLCDHGVAPPTAICGVLHAGMIGAPVDVREPTDRLRRLFEASGAEWVVTDRPHVDMARRLSDKVLVLDETQSFGAETPTVVVERDQPGLILFTSGSTGTPKGVYGAHRAIVPKSMRARTWPTHFDDRLALTSSWGFTAAEGMLFQGLINGATIYTYDLRTRGARGLPEWVGANGITTMTFMPSVARALAEDTPPGTMDCLRHVSFGAETLYAADVRAVRPMFGPETILRNALGSTEVGSIARYHIPPDVELEDGPVPIGQPFPSVHLRIVDEDDQPVPDGEPGRIVVSRFGHLALGYWRDPELTAAHFFVEADGRRGFRTCDRARLRDDGLLEHLGRLDTRVKVRGAMVATSEVEVALMSLDGVADAAVIAVAHADGGTRLVAYVVGDGATPLSAWRLRRDVATRVPTTMVPSTFVAVDALPRTVRHKIDRAALPPPPAPVTRPYREPTASSEADLAAIFADVLGVERVGLDDDFFEMGGDSLGVLELAALVVDRFSVDLVTSTVLEAPTVAELALRLSHRRPRDASPVVELRTGERGNPFFCVTGGGAPAISLRALSEAMADSNFSAIQARGLEERARPDHSVAAAARRNILAMRAAQPTGPYAIGGYSFGGLVAFEMACRLRAVGEDVALLVLLDSAAPTAERKIVNRLRARTRVLRADASRRPLRRVSVVASRAARFGVGSMYAHAERRISLTSAGLLPRRGYHQYDLFLRLNARMAYEYRPSGAFDGPVLVVRSDGADGIGHHRQHDLGWSELVTGPITAIEIPTDHFDLMRRPAVEKVGASISTALQSRTVQPSRAG
jgi:acyl-coenzyme A synthetase/AMP-(fatty) acid ligase/thioesterase domain-containing protein/acyl carrier protein